MQGTLAGAQLQSVSGAWRIAPSTIRTLHGSVRGAGIRRPAGPPTHLLACRPLPAVQEQRAGLQGHKQQQQRPGSGAGGGAGRPGGRRSAEALAAFVHSCFLRRQAVSMCAAVSQLGSACLCAAMPLCTLLLDKCRTNALPCLHLPLPSFRPAHAPPWGVICCSFNADAGQDQTSLASFCAFLLHALLQKRVQKKQQVVLTRDVPGLGSEGSLKAVPTGYWRNYLQPQGLAAFADDNILEQASLVLHCHTAGS